MKNRKKLTIKIFIISVIIILAGCPSPLLDIIQEEVQEVIAPPSVNTVFPDYFDSDIPIDTVISITFSKNISSSSIINGQSIIIEDESSSTVAGTISVANNTVSFSPTQNLTAQMTYTVTVDNSILDTDGNSLTKSFSWQFTTSTPPEGLSILINNGALWTNSELVILTIDAQDDTEVTEMNISNTPSFSTENWELFSNTKNWTLDSLSNGNKTVYIKFKDSVGYTSAYISSTIGYDTHSPVVQDLIIDNGKMSTTDSDVDIYIQGFDGLEGGGTSEFDSGAIGYRITTEDSNWPEWIDFTSGNNESISAYDLYATEETEVTIYAQVIDNGGNESQTIEKTIRVMDTTGPIIVGRSPHPDNTIYPAPQNTSVVSIEFDEPVETATINDSNFFISFQGIPQSGTISFSTDRKTIEITGLLLGQNSGYTVFLGSEVTDTAGNAIGGSDAWFFETDEASDTEPPVGQFKLDLDNPGVNSTQLNDPVLQIEATDLFNGVRAIKVWGDSDGTASFPTYEEDANWITYDPTLTTAGDIDYMPVSWNFDGVSGEKFIYYKVQDYLLNTAFGIYKVYLDNENPIINSVSAEDNSGYTNNPDGTIIVSIDAQDQHSGLNEMRIAGSSGSLAGATWIDWNPIIADYQLSAEGLHEIWVQVRDNVDLESTFPVTFNRSIVLDTTNPVVSFESQDIKNTNTGVSISRGGIFTDSPVAGDGIETYFWQQISGPATLLFDGETTGDTIAPVIAATGASGDDGQYVIRATVTDYSGNSSYGDIQFFWDTTSPGDPEGTAPNIYADTNSPFYNYFGGTHYSRSKQPTWGWDLVIGADYYEVYFSDIPGTVYTVTETSFTAGYERAEGNNTLEIIAYDDAGNYTSTGSSLIFVDSVSPTISNDGQLFLTNSLLTIDYTGIDGAVSETGSELDDSSTFWEQIGGNNEIQFPNSNSDTLKPDVMALSDGQYALKLSVADKSGNQTEAVFTLQWDTTPPNSPNANGTPHTPNVQPTWTWSSGGGGNNNYRIRIGHTNSSGGDPQVLFGWTDTTSENYTHASSLTNNRKYTLFVQEKDDAENWSDSDTFEIWVDTSYTSEPNITRDGSYLRNATDTSVIWNWSSGLGNPATEKYRWRLNGSNWTILADDVTSYTKVFSSTPGIDDGIHTFEVEEYNVSSSQWVGKISSSMVEIDATPPSAPTVNGTSPTNDNTPTWAWSPGSGDGIRIYKRKMNSSAWSPNTSSTSYTPGSGQSDGNYTLYIQEKDQAGNWSTSGSKLINIDTTVPTVSNILVDSGAVYTTDTSVLITFSYSDNPTEMRYYNSGWTTWETLDTSNYITLPSGDGTKAVYIQVRDAAGNTSAYIYDSIVLDTTYPVLNSFSINAGAVTTTSQTVTLNSNVSGASQMRFQNSSGGWSGWYTYTTSKSWSITANNGARRVNAEFRDSAGNTITTYDSIFRGTPMLNYASKGAYDDGLIKTYYDGSNYLSESGMSSTTYSLYYATSSTGTKIYKGNTSNTSYYNMTNMSEGVIYYIYMRAYNSEIGYSNYTGYAYGFTSDITIIYDDDDSADITVAQNMKNLLTWTTFPASYSAINGTMPAWTVTMFPEDFVSTSWYSSDDRYIIYGKPIILTPSVNIYSNANKTRNIAHKYVTTNGVTPVTVYDSSYKTGVVAMGYGGAKFLDTVNIYAGSWGMDSTSTYRKAPTDIGYNNSMISTSAIVMMYQWTAGNSTWYSPLTSTSFVGGTSPTHNAQVQLSYADLGGSTTTMYRVMVYRAGGSIPSYGDILLRDFTSTSHFPVVRQGRFMQFGLPIMPDRPYTGKAFFVNTIALMDNY